LTSVERNGGSSIFDLNITATDGGKVDLRGINGFDDSTSESQGKINISADGINSQVGISNVTSISDASLKVANGGEIAGQLTSLTGRSTLTKNRTDQIDLSALATANDATLVSADGATLDLGTINIDGTV
jgi:hypothetical protein